MRKRFTDPGVFGSKLTIGVQALLAALSTLSAVGQQTASPADVASAMLLPTSEMANVVRAYEADSGAVSRAYPVNGSPVRNARMKAFYNLYIEKLDGLKFEKFSLEGKVDWVLLHNAAKHDLHQLELDERNDAISAKMAPFAQIIFELAEARRAITQPVPDATAKSLTELRKQVQAAKKVLDEQISARKQEPTALERSQARRAEAYIRDLRYTLGEWYRFYDGYDPAFSWWNAEPFRAVDTEIDGYMRTIRERVMGVTAENPNAIIGFPIGREALEAELKFAMIPYSADELLAIGEREFAWCDAEMKKAAADMGCGDDWRKALERVKEDHVAPGEQPRLIRDLTLDGIAFVKSHDLITVPPMAEETWRMEMLSPERQLVSPFFLGGESIQVSFPTSSMSHEAKQMSLRGNNKHFAHATVFHEVIPGHHLQQFMNSRTMLHRGMFSTPFWTEGWALYWEMLMWDKGYHATPEDRIGALFWRTHRCARIVFSIKFHLGEMTPQECVDMLVDRVGHERANAEGEVRRSLSGDYGPLYQLAYMTGGLQLRALHKDVVGGGKMTDKQFHDMVMRENNMPIEMVRALVTGKAPAKDFSPSWRFDEALHQ
jgi:uncharacterized protein (DUF885 family)